MSERVFATVEDLAARWHPLLPGEQERAVALLEDASDMIRSEYPTWASIAPSTLKRIVCAMVRRALTAENTAFPAGATQFSQAAGPYNMSATFANPTGDMYLLESERRSLEAGASSAFLLTLGRGGAHDSR